MDKSAKHNLEILRLLGELVVELEQWPAELAAFAYDYEVFGSWRLTVRRNGQRTKFFYEGKESYLYAERLGPEPWELQAPRTHLGTIGLRGLAATNLPAVIDFIRTNTQ